MHKNRFSLLAALTCAIFAVVSTPRADAQAYKVDAKKPDFDDFPSPEFSGGKQKNFKPKEWLEIEASIQVQMAPEPPSKTADRILVKWYVAVENPDKKGTYLLLTKDITHVNVPLGEEVFSSVYLSPASVRRLSGYDRAGKSLVYLVGYDKSESAFAHMWWDRYAEILKERR
jgi:hypothetical protein